MIAEYIPLLLIILYYAYSKYRDSKYRDSKRRALNTISHREQTETVRKALGVPAFHTKNITGKGIKVGILDTKIAEHPDLIGVTRLGYNYVGGNEGSHGTHVCGIIKNIVPDAEIYSAMAFTGDDPNTSLGAGIKLLVDAGCQVINISIGSNNTYASMRNDVKMPFGDKKMTMHEIYEHLEERGVIIVLACGNGSSTYWGKEVLSDLTQNADDYNYVYGKDVPKTSMNEWPIVVTSCKLPDDKKLGPMGEYTSGFSEFNTLNKSNNIISYGEDIWSLSHDSNYTEMSGTSMAAPQVTGAIALIYSALQKEDDDKKKGDDEKKDDEKKDDEKKGHDEKKKRAKKVRDYLLKDCTIREMDGADKYLPSVSDMKNINEIIDDPEEPYLELKVDDTDITKDMAEMKDTLEYFLSRDDVIKNNAQFRSYNIGEDSLFQLLEKYREVREKVNYKYTTLSLGYGVLHLKLDEDGKYKSSKKDPFGYAPKKTN